MNAKQILRKAVDFFSTTVGFFVLLVAILALIAICARCSDPVAFDWDGGDEIAGALPPVDDGPLVVTPIPPVSQVIEGASPADKFTLPWLVTLGLGERDTFRLRMEGTGDQELVLFQVDTLVARFTPNWQVGSRRGSLAPSDFTGLLADAQVIHVEIEHFGTGGFHEWSVPVEGKAIGKAQVFFLWQRADGSNPKHGSLEVRVQS